jgi:hypothetical protein
LAGRLYLLSDWATAAFVPKAAALLATIAVAGGTFFALCLALRTEELTPIVAAVKRRLAR